MQTSQADVQVCSVASQPGHTKELQTVQLERGLKVVDSPGVVFDDADDTVDSAGRARAAKGSVLLRNVIKVEDIEDPVEIGQSCRSFIREISILIWSMQLTKYYQERPKG